MNGIRRLAAALLVVFAAGMFCPPAHAAGRYTDVPADSWALDIIERASDYRLIDGVGDSRFGYGSSMTRAAFVTVVCRMFAWETVSPGAASFSDVPSDAWYYPYVETALAHGAFDRSDCFYPARDITREEMAVMLVRALGYSGIAQSMESAELPFTDVTRNRGYIAVAYDIGMITGKSPDTFAPDAGAKREEAAAMLVRLYEKLNSHTEWLHGFYAFSSYSQRQLAREMDAVSMGWSRMTYSAEGGAALVTSADGGNEWNIPDSYESIVNYLDEGGVKMNLSVYMDNAGGQLAAMLLSEDGRAEAADAIMAELSRVYPELGRNPYSGVTVDFEGLRADCRQAFSQFLRELSAKLDGSGKALYVTVQPAAPGGYYDGYDYRTIGELADRVILMAHDYQSADLSEYVGTEYYKNTPLTPINSVYYSLRAITDAETGVADRSKIALALSFSSLAWKLSGGKLAEPSAYVPSSETIHARLLQSGTELGWSEFSKNPYARYTVDGDSYFLWYEDARSVGEKLRLARLFGIDGVSVWRLGNIPNYGESGIEYDAFGALR